jgi:isopenicillin-N epimerase
MTSRRKFIKTAGLLGGLTSIPFAGKGIELSSNGYLEAFRNSATDDDLFALVRKQLLVPANRVYLNTGSLGPSPFPVMDAVTAATRQLEMNPVSENWGPLGIQMEDVRKKVAQFIHAETEEIILTRNTTEGLNLIGQSLELKKGDEILTTTLEHGGGEVGLEFLVQTKGATLKKVELPMPSKSAEQVVKIIAASITPKTKLVMLSHVNTVTGLLMPLAEISKITKPRGIYLVVDGAQAPGQVNVDVKALGIDAYAASGHKWILGPKETGFLYLSKKFQEKVKPVFIHSGVAAYTASSGTRNVATIIGLGTALDWHQFIGVDKIQKRCAEIRTYCLSELKKLNGFRIISPAEESLSTAMVSFSLESKKNTDIYTKLKELDIIVKVLPQHNAIRISCHLFVSKPDIDKFIQALKPLL